MKTRTVATAVATCMAVLGAATGVARAQSGLLTPEARASQEEHGGITDSEFARTGQVTLSGTIGFGSFGNTQAAVFDLSNVSPQGADSTSTSTLGIQGQVGYFFAQNLEIGAGLLAGQSSNTDTPPPATMTMSTTTSTISFALLPYVRYHLALRRDIFFYFGGAVGYQSAQVTITGGTTGSASINGLRVGGFGGIEVATGHLLLGIGPEFTYWLASNASGGTTTPEPTFDIAVTGRIGAFF